MKMFYVMLSEMTGDMVHPMISTQESKIEFSPQLIKLLVEGRLKRAYGRILL